MKRKDFINKGLVTGAFLGSSAYASPLHTKAQGEMENPAADDEEIVIEKAIPNKPHKGKVLLAIQAHSDDIPLFAGGLVAKLMDEGYTGYLLRTSDDGKGNYQDNKTDNEKIAEAYGMKKAYDFMYPHHQMDNMGIQDLKGRLIFLFRLLKVDTLVCWDPWEHYEENPDHYVTARAVEAARWMAGTNWDYPEHRDANLKPHTPREVYYYSRDVQRVNRIVDITNYIDKKVEVNLLNVTKGPAGNNGQRLREKLAAENKQLPILGNDDKTANFMYTKHFVFDIDSERLNYGQVSNKKIGEKYGLEWAEKYRYIKENSGPNKLEEYIKENAKPL